MLRKIKKIESLGEQEVSYIDDLVCEISKEDLKDVKEAIAMKDVKGRLGETMAVLAIAVFMFFSLSVAIFTNIFGKDWNTAFSLLMAIPFGVILFKTFWTATVEIIQNTRKQENLEGQERPNELRVADIFYTLLMEAGELQFLDKSKVEKVKKGLHDLFFEETISKHDLIRDTVKITDNAYYQAKLLLNEINDEKK